jgi:hypothetical protein
VGVKHGARLFFGIASVLVAVGACSSGGSDRDDGSHLGDDGATAGTASSLPPGVGSGDPEPEQEQDPAFRVPVVSGRWVWTANPTSGRVALIDAKSFTVKTALAGAAPTYLTALPAADGRSRALVLNTVSQDASLLSASEGGDIEVGASLPVHAGANAWAVTSDGHFAIAWTNATLVANADPSQGFQDITVLDLAASPPASKRLSVGYRPTRLFMDDDDRYVYVATDAGIDVVDLASDDGPIVERELALSDHPARDTARRDVSVTPGGDYAFVRRDGQSNLTIVDIAHGKLKDLVLPGVVTDLDLTRDAKLAVAIIRDRVIPADSSAEGAGQLGEGGSGGADVDVEGGAAGAADVGAAGAGGSTSSPGRASVAVLLPVDTIFDAPDVYDQVELEELFGSVEIGARSETGLLFSNAVPSTHLTLLGLTEREHRTVDLKLPVFTAVSSPDGAHALALLQPRGGSQQPGAFAVVPVEKNLPPRIQGTQAPTVPVDSANDLPAMVAVGDRHALVTVSNGRDVNVAYLVSMPELTVDTFDLASAPLPQASGLVPEANQAFVAQRHPEGRITFIDLDSKAQHTLTGFELSTKVGK